MSSPFSNAPVGAVFSKNDGLRFLDKDKTCAERELMNSWWQEIICQYGVETNYFVHGYDLLHHDSIYGEDPTRPFHDPKKIIMAVTISEASINLNTHGYDAPDEVTATISMKGFTDAFGLSAEPKAGDLFELIEYGNTRPGGRTGKIFEITRRTDQDADQINQLQGHYVWFINARRYDYSFEPNAPREGMSEQVNDDTFNGRIGKDDEKSYGPDADTLSKSIFDYDKYYGADDNVYGGYV